MKITKDSELLKRRYKKLLSCSILLFVISCVLVIYMAALGFLLLMISLILGVKSVRAKRELEKNGERNYEELFCNIGNI